VHCGYEPTAVHQTFNNLRGFARTVVAQFNGPNSRSGRDIAPPVVAKSVETGIDHAPRSGLDHDLQEVLDFRGNALLTLTDGSTREGFVFNVAEGLIEMFPAGEAGVWIIPRANVAAAQPSGRDPADGKSWEAWVKKYNDNKARREAGEKVASVGLFPDPL
jgi:hypothetical protein